MPSNEGWPVGLFEALRILERRGVLLGIISKNDEARVLEAWPKVFGGRLTLEDFAIRRINWQPKPVNMAEILATLNLLPGNVLYIGHPNQRAWTHDGNPAGSIRCRDLRKPRRSGKIRSET